MGKIHILAGRKQSLEHVQKRVESIAKDRATWSDEKIALWKSKISKNSKARDPEVRAKNSQAHMGRVPWNKGLKFPEYSGENHPMFGKKHKPESIEKMKLAQLGKKQSPELIAKRITPLVGRPRPEEVKQKLREANLKTWSRPEIRAKVTGENNPCWNGLYSRDLCQYDKYIDQLSGIEKCRRWGEDNRVLEVKCTYCGRWFRPRIINVNQRVRYINGKSVQEGRLYCSKECKSLCPIYKRISRPRDYYLGTSREVQAELRQIVFERDNWQCQICFSDKSLHCHHYEGVIKNPIESADVDNCITLCKDHHVRVHTYEGCGYHDLKC